MSLPAKIHVNGAPYLGAEFHLNRRTGDRRSLFRQQPLNL